MILVAISPRGCARAVHVVRDNATPAEYQRAYEFVTDHSDREVVLETKEAFQQRCFEVPPCPHDVADRDRRRAAFKAAIAEPHP